MKKIEFLSAFICCCYAIVSGRQLKQRFFTNREDVDGVVENNWNQGGVFDEPAVSWDPQGEQASNPDLQAVESWKPENTGDVYYESDASDWIPGEDFQEEWDEDEDSDDNVEEQNQRNIPEPWTESTPETVDCIDSDISTEPNDSEFSESIPSPPSTVEYGEHHDGHHDHEGWESNQDALEELLPADVYSQDYIEALRRIGIENIAAGAKGITYSFYTSAGACKSPEDITRDVSMIEGFEVIRIYDTDCDGLANILKAIGPNQKVFAGIHYPENVENSVEIINRAVQENAGGDWSKIHTVSVGNEMVNFGKATPADLQASIGKAKSLLSTKGYDGPVVTTDTLVAVLNNRELCDISDYIAVNSHPYWDGGVPAQQAGPWLESQLQMLDDVCGRNGKQIFLAETGWPHKGKRFGQHGDPSKDNQLVAIKSIVDTLGPRTILFTTFNDYWKDGGTHDVEKFWGIFENN